MMLQWDPILARLMRCRMTRRRGDNRREKRVSAGELNRELTALKRMFNALALAWLRAADRYIRLCHRLENPKWSATASVATHRCRCGWDSVGSGQNQERPRSCLSIHVWELRALLETQRDLRDHTSWTRNALPVGLPSQWSSRENASVVFGPRVPPCRVSRASTARPSSYCCSESGASGSARARRDADDRPQDALSIRTLQHVSSGDLRSAAHKLDELVPLGV